MSYTKNISHTISGSKVVSYPASKSGGWITVNWQEQVNVNIEVDTDVFDNSVMSCNNHINALSGAIVLTNTLQCKEIENSAKQISNSIIDGFFNTISSEITQQMSDANNLYEAKFALLQQQSKSAYDLKHVMEKDYHRISSRYADIFENLNIECRRRIEAIDIMSFSLGQNGLTHLYRSAQDMASISMLVQQDVTTLKGIIEKNHVLNHAFDIFKRVGESLRKYTGFKKEISSSVHDISDKPGAVVYIPLIITISDALLNEKKEMKVVLPIGYPESKVSDIYQYLSDNKHTLSWIDDDGSLDDRIDSYITENADAILNENNDDYSKRIVDYIMNMWESNKLMKLEETRS